MKKKLLFIILSCGLFIGNVKGLTFSKVTESYKEKVLNNEMFKESSDKISFTDNDNNLTVHVDFTEEELEDLSKLDVVFNYTDGKLKYSYDGELNDEIDESKYLLNTLLANLMYYTVGELNGFSEKQMQNTLTEDITKSFTLEKNGIEFNLLKYEKSESGAISGGVYFTKSFNLDLNKFNIGEKRDHGVYLEFSEIVAQFKKDFDSFSNNLEMNCSMESTENEIKVICSKNEVGTEFAFKYSDNLITYDLSSNEDAEKQINEMVISNLYSQLLLKSIAVLNKYSDEEILSALTDIYTKDVSLEVNGIEFTEKNIHTEDNDSVVSVIGDVSGVSNLKIDLNKFNLDNLIKINNKVEDNNSGEKCSEKDGKYYDKNGNSVSKEAYFESCGVVENPKTGLMIPLIILGLFGITGISLIIKRKTYFEKI